MAKKKHPALVPETYPRSVRWKVDCDYLDELSPKDQEFMAEFLNAEYNGVFSEKAKANWSTASRRQAYRNKNYANSSAVDNSHPSVDEVDESVEASPETDWSSPPAYLESLEYKQALEELRAAINNRKEPGSDEALRVARRRLEQIRVESESEEE